MLIIAALLASLPANAAAQDANCLSAPVPEPTGDPLPLVFGITPLLAGTSGGSQGAVLPEDPAKASVKLQALQPPGRRLVMRINRVFESDGAAGLARAAKLAAGYAQAGFDVESQVRYHPAADQDGDMEAWERYVRQAVDRLATSRALVALTITNEVNLPISANTSDGAFKDAISAIVRGVVAARQELADIGRSDVAVGFSYAYRYAPSEDVKFWKQIGAAATPAFRAALSYVGVQLYPGLFWPPVLTPGQTAGDATIDALALVRGCYMPLAGLGPEVQIWITENGYPTNLGHTADQQVTDLTTTIESVRRWSRTLGVTDYRYFNLRDNRPDGTDLFDDVGLLAADYSEKPAFAAYRDLVARYGATPAPRACTVTLRLPRPRPRERYRRVRAAVDGRRVRARLRGRTVLLSVPAGRHTVRLTARTSRKRTVKVSRESACVD